MIVVGAFYAWGKRTSENSLPPGMSSTTDY